MATQESTTIPRARGIHAATATQPAGQAPSSTRATRRNARARTARSLRPHTFTRELQSHTLGHFNDALGFIETARTALQSNETAACATATLAHGLDMLRHVYNVLDRVEPATSTNAEPTHRRKPRRAS